MYKSKITTAILILVFFAPLASASPDRDRDHGWRDRNDSYSNNNSYNNRHKNGHKNSYNNSYNYSRNYNHDRRDHHEHGNYSNNHNHHKKFAKVIRVRPVYKTIRIKQPGRHCSNQRHRHTDVTVVHQHSPEKVILGGVIGGIVGHEFSTPHNRELSTLAGVIVGSSLAHNATSANYIISQDRDHGYNDCYRHMRVIEKQKLIGYKVKYKYRGRIFTTRTTYHPGKRIAVHPNSGKRHDYY